jgi:DNA polymerase
LSAPYDRILTIDMETRWSTKPNEWTDTPFTLSKMTTEEYIRDGRFNVFGACIHEFGSDGITQWYRGEELPRILSTYDWRRTAVLAHNAQFDISILSWRYGVKPAFIFDTLSMARALRGVEVGNSLAKLAGDFGLPAKGTAVHNTDGLRELAPEIEAELAAYCKHDVFLCEEIFKRLVVGYPSSELRLINMTLKMYTEPVLQLDKLMLANALEEEKEKRESLLQRLDVTDSMLASNDQFAELLRTIGVEPPTKKKKPTVKTPNPVGTTFAFAKTDAMFQAMLNGSNEDAAALCEARLKVKSTSERTRAQRFLEIAGRGPLPVPLSYYGAGTGRWTASKGSAINMQNLKRGSFLRKAIMAPEGYQLVVGDLSQIEPRVLAWLSDYEEMLDIFRAGGDPYAAFGAQMFSIPGMTKDSHPVHRQSAKSALLGAGFQLGWASFAQQLLVGFLGAPPLRYTKTEALQLGVTSAYIQKFLDWEENLEKMMEIPHTCTTEELLVHCVAAKKIIDMYRSTAAQVVSFWEMLTGLIQTALFEGCEHTHKCLTFRKEEIELPNGMKLLYPNLRKQKNKETKKEEWVYGEDATKLYAGKIANNVTQATARIVMTDGMLRVSKKYFVAGTVHDEQIAVVPDEEVEFAKTWVLAQMTMEPRYMPGIPLAADGGAHRRYGLAKG